jgi:hypothetical protein
MYSRWGSYSEKIEQSVIYNLPLYVSINYHLNTKHIKPHFGILSGLNIEKMSFKTTIRDANEPSQSSNEDDFNNYFLVGTDIGANWFFQRHLGITIGFAPQFVIEKQFLRFTGIFHGGIIYSL